jgi:hypothetical protein
MMLCHLLNSSSHNTETSVRALQSGSGISGPGGSAIARVLAVNNSLRGLDLFWSDLALSSLQDIAGALTSNTSLTSLSIGDPVTLSDDEAAEACSRILRQARPSLKRLSLAYVPFPSLSAAHAFCAALEGNIGEPRSTLH